MKYTTIHNAITRAIIGGVFSLASAVSVASPSANDIARLGKDLTLVGAEQAGNADGSIPAWTGGITKPPSGYVKDKGYTDPFGNEKPVYIVTGENADQYADILTEGYKALLAKYPNYKMLVYPTHRTAALPQAEYDLIREEAYSVQLAPGGNGMLNYEKSSVPFPLPTSGLEVIYNHFVRYRVGGYKYYPTEMVVKSSGNFNPVHREVTLVMASALGIQSQIVCITT